MDPVLVLAAAAALLLVIVAALLRSLAASRAALRELRSAKQSQSTRYGQISEQFAPWMQEWPWDPKRFHFLGSPIDGIQFTDEGVVFVEIKSASSRLSAVQRQVRDQVLAGHVHWREFRIG